MNAAIGKLALRLLRGTKRACAAVWPLVKGAVSLAGRLVSRVFILPAYSFAILARLKYARLAIPARGVFFYLFTHRNLFHAVVVVLVVGTVGANLYGAQAKAQDVGQKSLLYGIVAGTNARTTEEAVRPDHVAQATSYTGDSALIATPDIDFNYYEIEPELVMEPSAPDAIIAEYTSHDPNEPLGPPAPRTGTEVYTVAPGDSLSVIAQRFGVNVGTILWANNRSAYQYIRPGDTLRIPPVSGVLVTVKKGDTLNALALKYDSEIDEILRVNRLSAEEDIPIGLEIVLPGGRPPYTPPPAPTTAPDTGRSTGPRPANADTSDLPKGKLLWPTSGYTITQYYGWRHTGLDIDGDYSSPIYASHDGTVTVSGWNKGGYGLQLVVSGDGVMTRYAHASKVFVAVGDTVKKGDVIAMVGTTGRSTGTHLHYEVYLNGKRVNPLAYIK
jgi:murein DD-endopeptidase MepM/ murein hydrolase activator NlpD